MSTHRIITIVATQIRCGASTFWSLADQGIVSLGSFLTTVVLARNMLPADYGLFALILSALIFVNGLQSTLVGYPLIVRGSLLAPDTLSRFASNASGITFLFGLFGAVILCVVIVWSGNGAILALTSGSALLCWQLQQTTRSAFVARQDYRKAVFGDSISYLGQAAIVWLMAFNTSAEVFATIASTSIVAFLFQCRQLKLFTPPSRLWEMTCICWTLGRWATAAALLNGLVLQLFIFGLASSHGSSEVARYQVVVNLLGICRPVIMSVGNLIIPGVALAAARGTVSDVDAIAAKRSLPLAALLCPPLIILATAPNGALASLYGDSSPYISLAGPLRWFVLAYALVFLSSILGSILNGIQNSFYRLLAQGASLITSIVVGLPMTFAYGVSGAAAGYAIANFALLVAALKFVLASREKGYSGK